MQFSYNAKHSNSRTCNMDTQQTYSTKGNINHNVINIRELSDQLLFHWKRSQILSSAVRLEPLSHTDTKKNTKNWIKQKEDNGQAQI